MPSYAQLTDENDIKCITIEHDMYTYTFLLLFKDNYNISNNDMKDTIHVMRIFQAIEVPYLI